MVPLGENNYFRKEIKQIILYGNYLDLIAA